MAMSVEVKSASALVLLAAGRGELGALGEEDFKEAVDEAAEVVAGADFEERRGEAGIEGEGSGVIAEDVGDAKGGAAFAGLVGGEEAEVFAGDLDGLLAGAGVLVAEGGDLRGVAGAGGTAGLGDVDALLAIVGDSEVNVEVAHARVEEVGEGFGGWGGVGGRNVEEEAVGKDAGDLRDFKLAQREGFLIDDDLAEPPGAELKGGQAEVYAVLEEAILELEVLRGEEGSLGPEDGLELFHKFPIPTRSCGVTVNVVTMSMSILEARLRLFLSVRFHHL